ncbi:MAG: DUF167 domain-containing protein [Gammaproteobacteria bacterium]|nr:DUF167 domain-containing protein [Gammaproteobacteria bacterium]
MAEPKNQGHVLPETFYFWDGDVLVLDILGKPGARQDAIGRVQGNKLKIHVAATAESGRATRHMLGFLADAFGVSRTAIEVVFGARSVHKRVRIQSPRNLPAGIRKRP